MTDAELEQLTKTFELVENKTHWKDPIDTVIDAANVSIKAVYDAVVHFTGTVPTFTHQGNTLFQVTADGYRNGPCGDH